MRFQGSTLLALSALVMLAGCAKVKKIEVRASVVKDGGGNPIGVKIDKTHHDTAVVTRGQRIEWACDCEEGIEFTLDNLRLAGDLDDIVEMLLRNGVENPEVLDRRVRELELLQRELGPSDPAPGQDRAAQSGPSAPMVDLLAGLKDLQWALNPAREWAKEHKRVRTEPLAQAPEELERAEKVPEPARARTDLFVERWSPPDFQAASEPIRSPRVGKFERHELWVFTWKVRLKETGSTADWDPHIYGHPEMKM